jgi:hypothetical protein
LVQPSPPGWVQPNRPGPGSVKPTQSRPLTRTPLSLPSSSSATAVATAIARRFWPTQATSAAATWGKQCASLSTASSTKWIWGTPPLQGDPLPSLAWDPSAPTTSDHDATVVTLAVLVLCFCGVFGDRAAQVEASPMGAPCAVTPPPVKTTLGRVWSAA